MMAEYRIERDGQLPLTFTGEQLALARLQNAGGDVLAHTTVELYRTAASNRLVVGRRIDTGENSFRDAVVCDSYQEIIDWVAWPEMTDLLFQRAGIDPTEHVD